MPPPSPASRAALLLHPVRLRIVQALLGRARTPLELVDDLRDVPQATVYRHVNALVEGGMLAVTSERPVRGSTERRYTVVEADVHLSAADLRGLDGEAHLQHFLTFIGTVAAGFGRAVEGEGAVDLEAEGIGYTTTPLWLDDEEMADVLAALRRALADARTNGPGPGRRRRLLTTIVHPDGPRPP